MLSRYLDQEYKGYGFFAASVELTRGVEVTRTFAPNWLIHLRGNGVTETS